MRRVFTAVGVCATLLVAGCNKSATEKEADSIEQNVEEQADSLEELSDNVATEAGEKELQSKADRVREKGKDRAAAVRDQKK